MDTSQQQEQAVADALNMITQSPEAKMAQKAISIRMAQWANNASAQELATAGMIDAAKIRSQADAQELELRRIKLGEKTFEEVDKVLAKMQVDRSNWEKVIQEGTLAARNREIDMAGAEAYLRYIGTLQSKALSSQNKENLIAIANLAHGFMKDTLDKAKMTPEEYIKQNPEDTKFKTFYDASFSIVDSLIKKKEDEGEIDPQTIQILDSLLTGFSKTMGFGTRGIKTTITPSSPSAPPAQAGVATKQAPKTQAEATEYLDKTYFGGQ